MRAKSRGIDLEWRCSTFGFNNADYSCHLHTHQGGKGGFPRRPPPDEGRRMSCGGTLNWAKSWRIRGLQLFLLKVILYFLSGQLEKLYPKNYLFFANPILHTIIY